MEAERRAPIHSLLHIEPEPRRVGVRENLGSSQEGLDGVSGPASRKVVRWWPSSSISGRATATRRSPPLDVESASKGQTIRIETTITDWWSEPEFWEEVGHMADTVELADRCGQPP